MLIVSSYYLLLINLRNKINDNIRDCEFDVVIIFLVERCSFLLTFFDFTLLLKETNRMGIETDRSHKEGDYNRKLGQRQIKFIMPNMQ